VDEPESSNFFNADNATPTNPPSGPDGYEAAWYWFEGEPADPGPATGTIDPTWVTGHRGQGIELDNGHIRSALRFVHPTSGGQTYLNPKFTSGAVTLNTWIYWRGEGRKTLGEDDDAYNTNEKNQIIFFLTGPNSSLKVSINDDVNELNGTAANSTNAILAAAGKSGLMAKVTAQGKAPVPLVPDQEFGKFEWHMVTFTFDGAEAALFLDGNELLRQDCAADYWGDVSAPLSGFNIGIFRMGGSSYAGGSPTLNAIIDDASYWQAALSADAIKSMWYATKGE
jgi:hypothetical protein